MKVVLSCLTLCDPMDYTAHGILQTRILKWVAFPFSRGSSQPRSSTLHMDSLTAEPPGKPKNTGVDSLSLLQWIFLTQDLNQSLLHCRWILYQLHYQGIELASLVAQMVKRLPTMREIWVRFLGREYPLEKEMAIYSSTLAWKIPWMEEPDRLLQSMGSQRVGHD